MKTCLYCKIDVGGNLKKCPLCQSKLQGESEQAYFQSRLHYRFSPWYLSCNHLLYGLQ